MRKLVEPTLVLATHNRGKQEEMAHLLEPYGKRVLCAADLGLIVPEETETTFVGNARLKAHAAARVTGLPALADDSGLCVDALGGAPGVWTADWAETPNGRDFVKAMSRLWQELENLGAAYPRRAAFVCTLVLAWPDGHDLVFEGSVEGEIVWPMRGDIGHGFDPVFQPDGFDITFGEMDRWEKNRISHRGRAFDRLLSGCFT